MYPNYLIMTIFSCLYLDYPLQCLLPCFVSDSDVERACSSVRAMKFSLSCHPIIITNQARLRFLRRHNHLPRHTVPRISQHFIDLIKKNAEIKKTMASSKSTLPLSEAPKLVYNHSESNIRGLCTQLQQSHAIRHSIDLASRIPKSHTPHSPALDSQIPLAVLYPRSTEDVSAIVKACHERHIAITAFAGGTSLGGALTATRAGVCVDFGGMDRVLAFHEEDMVVVVQPGVGWVELNEVLEGRGLFFPVDPAPGARIGGMVSEYFLLLYSLSLYGGVSIHIWRFLIAASCGSWEICRASIIEVR